MDGVLFDTDPPCNGLRNAIVSRTKILANLDIAERRLSQDGRLRQVIQCKEIDFCVSTTPLIPGENVGPRVLARRATMLDDAAPSKQARENAGLGWRAVATSGSRSLPSDPSVRS